jgi:hypothetical protein
MGNSYQKGVNEKYFVFEGEDCFFMRASPTYCGEVMAAAHLDRRA